MKPSLYTDFSVSLEHCEKEPIHRPGAIQGHGFILIIDEKFHRLVGLSQNLIEFTHSKEADWWTEDWIQFLPKMLYQSFKSLTKGEPLRDHSYQRIEWNDQVLDLIIHRHNGLLFFELEKATEFDEAQLNSFEAMEQFRTETSSVNHIEDYYQAAAKQLKAVSGYDRVMVYAFHKDGHGEVVGEALEPHLEPFFGLHYPVSDIPYIARKLFLANEIRIISDIYRPYSPICYRPGLVLKESFDLTHSHLRVSSPIHLEYLKNMGVQSTFTIAIKHQGTLWGLFAFHHYSPRLISLKQRRICNFLGDSFAARFIQHQYDEQHKKEIEQRTKLEEVFNILDHKRSVLFALKEEEIDLAELFDADGYWVHIKEEEMESGYTPSAEKRKKLLNYLKHQKAPKVFHTSCIDELLEGYDPNDEDPIGGVLFLRLSEMDNHFILLFKKPVVQTVTWGGNPNKAMSAQKVLEDGSIRLSPRKSFAKWKIESGSNSLPWNNLDLDIAERLRDKVEHVYLQSEGEIARLNQKLTKSKTELDEFVYVASHDMQEPLRSMINYVDLLQRDQYRNDPATFKQFTERIKLNGERMREMIHDLLQYSRIGRIQDSDWEYVSMIEVISTVRQNLAYSIQHTEALITMESLPDIFGLKSELIRLFQNLISNSIKYVEVGKQPRIHIDAKRIGNQWRFSIQDNGIGIDETYQNKVFQLFQRLHDQRVYQGNGIGLAICKKIMDLHKGDLWFKSIIGEGSTFYMTFNAPK